MDMKVLQGLLQQKENEADNWREECRKLQSELDRQYKLIEILQKNADTAFQDGLNEMRDLVNPEIVKEVCDKIRKHASERIEDNVVEFIISADFLDQIEQGEK